MFNASPTHKFVGLVSSAVISETSQFIAVMPLWAESVREWASWLMLIIGMIGALMYATCMALDAQKKWHSARDAHRKELQELRRKVDDERCKLRQVEGICPALKIISGDCVERQTQNKCRMQEIAAMHAPGTLMPQPNQ